METISLTEKQRERAQNILEQIDDKEINHPEDLVNTWEPKPDDEEINEMSEVNIFERRLSQDKRYVPTSNIVGNNKYSIDYIQPRRIKKITNWLLDGEFERKNFAPPTLESIGENYYIYTDGTHRVLTFKSIGIEEIYAKVTDIPME